jgi:hypothetical protein
VTSLSAVRDVVDAVEAFGVALSDRNRHAIRAASDCGAITPARARVVASFTRVTGATPALAQRWTALVQAGLQALGWDDVRAHRREISELVELVLNPRRDRRYAHLVRLAEARAAVDGSLGRPATGVRPTTTIDLVELGLRVRSGQRDFARAWRQGQQRRQTG